MKMKKLLATVLALASCVAIPGYAQTTKDTPKDELTLVLDWVPNTNHTGIFVAKDKGYFADEGITMNIVQPAEDSSSIIVGSGRAQLGIYFQPNMVKRLQKNVPITAVAAILQHNTGGILASKKADINSPKDLTDKRFSTWQDPIDDATIAHIVNKDGGDWGKVQLIPGESTNAIAGIKANMYDAIFIYYGWDGIYAEMNNAPTNYFNLTDYEPKFDYYSPVIIANDDFLKNKPEVAKRALKAIKKGYELAIKDPAAAADILIKNAPEGDAELIKASQQWLSKKYIDDASTWGVIDAERWNGFYAWLFEKGLTEKKIEGGFTNDYLPQ